MAGYILEVYPEELRVVTNAIFVYYFVHPNLGFDRFFEK